MSRVTLATIATHVSLVWILGCSAAPARRASDKLPFIVRVNHIDLPRPGDEEVVPALFPEDTQQILATYLEEVFVGVEIGSIGSNLPSRADLEVDIRIEGSDFGEGTARIPYTGLSTVLWFAAGHLSWFIEDRAYPRATSNVMATMTIRPIGEKKEVYRRGFHDNLRLNNWERTRTTVGNALLNIIVPPGFVPGDPQVEGSSLADKYLESFGARQIDLIWSELPGDHLSVLDCFLVHDRDRIILVSTRRISGLEIGERRLELAHDVARYSVLEADKDGIRDRLSVLRPELSLGVHDFFYEIKLNNDEGDSPYIPIRATLDGGRAQWTILRESAVDSSRV